MSNILCLILLIGAALGCAATGPIELDTDPDTPITPIASAMSTNLMPQADRTVMLQVRTDQQEPAQHRMTNRKDEKKLESKIADLRGTSFLYQENKGIFITEEVEQSDNVRIGYEPALLHLPWRLTADQPAVAKVKMTVRSLETGQVQHQGECEITLKLVGGQRIETPAGKVDTVVIDEVRKIDLGVAQATVRSRTFYQPGVGMVREQIERKTKALGLFETTSHQILELAAPAP